MFYADAYIRNDGKVDLVKITAMNGTDAKAEYKGKEFDSAYDMESKMFFVNGGPVPGHSIRALK